MISFQYGYNPRRKKKDINKEIKDIIKNPSHCILLILGKSGKVKGNLEKSCEKNTCHLLLSSILKAIFHLFFNSKMYITINQYW